MHTWSVISPSKENEILSDVVDEPWKHTKRNKPERERQTLFDATYIWNLKYDTDEPVHETNRIRGIHTRLVVASRGGRWVRDGLGVWN